MDAICASFVVIVCHRYVHSDGGVLQVIYDRIGVENYCEKLCTIPPGVSESLRLLISDNGVGSRVQKSVFKQGIKAYQSIRVTVVTLKSKTFIGKVFFQKTYTLERVMEMTVTTVTFEILVF